MNISSTSTGHANFFAMRDAAALRMGASGSTSGAAATRGTGRTEPASNISLTKPARPVDPLLAAQSNRGPIKGGLIDFIA